jgi:hypothetical protein
MMKWLCGRLIDQGERQTGQSAEFLRDILKSSSSGFWKFALFMPLSRHRAHAPKELWHLAHIGADMAEDCGPCTQIAVDMAADAGVPAATLQAVVAGRLQDLAPLEALALQFGKAVSANDPAAEEMRLKLEAAIGAKAMVDLAIAIATARIFPALKRALGHATACHLVQVKVGQAA